MHRAGLLICAVPTVTTSALGAYNVYILYLYICILIYTYVLVFTTLYMYSNILPPLCGC